MGTESAINQSEYIQVNWDNVKANSSLIVLEAHSEIKVIGLEDYKSISLSVYPIPAMNRLNIDADIEFNNYEISTASGVKVKKGLINDQSLDLDDLNSGAYVLTLFSDKSHYTLKVVKK